MAIAASIKYPAFINNALAHLPAHERLAAVKQKNYADETLLHDTALNPILLLAILDLYPESERFAAVKRRTYKGETVLHQATSNATSLKIILGPYLPQDRLAAIKEENLNGTTVLERAFFESTVVLQEILKLLPNDEKLIVLRTKIKDKSLLDRIINKPIIFAQYNDAFKPSFLADYLTIIEVLTQHKNANPANQSFFNRLTQEAQALRTSLYTMTSFQALKETLIDYVSNHTNTVIAQALLQRTIVTR